METGLIIVATELASGVVEGIVALNGAEKWISASSADNCGALVILTVFSIRFGLISRILEKSSKEKERKDSHISLYIN